VRAAAKELEPPELMEIPAARMKRIGGPWPRSRSAAYRYRARLCVDAAGKVTSASLLEGPRRMKGRIEWALRRWRYQPHSQGGHPEPACFVISDRVRKISDRERDHG
jgi:hypothetical protein